MTLDWRNRLFYPKLCLKVLLLGSVAMTLSACGYTLMSSRSDVLIKRGIRKIYLAPLRNETFKPGIENLVYNAVLKEIQAGRRVKIVKDLDEADAVLRGFVAEANQSSRQTQQARSLQPQKSRDGRTFNDALVDLKAPARMNVASEYGASLSCSFELVKISRKLEVLPGQVSAPPITPSPMESETQSEREYLEVLPTGTRQVAIWDAGFSRSKVFVANTKLGVLGTTSELINESEFDRALRDLAKSIAQDMHVAMLEMF